MIDATGNWPLITGYWVLKPDYYRILGLTGTATQREIKSAYRRLAFQNHPDHNPEDPAAAERFKEIVEAYRVLSDPDKRWDYDRSRLIEKPYATQRSQTVHGDSESSYEAHTEWLLEHTSSWALPWTVILADACAGSFLSLMSYGSIVLWSGALGEAASIYGAFLALSVVSLLGRFVSSHRHLTVWDAGALCLTSVGLVVAGPLFGNWLSPVAPSVVSQGVGLAALTYAVIASAIASPIGSAMSRAMRPALGFVGASAWGSFVGALLSAMIGVFLWFWGAVLQWTNVEVREEPALYAIIGVLAAIAGTVTASCLEALRNPVKQ